MFRRLASIALIALPIVAPAEPLPRFPAGATWNHDISRAPLAANSASMISTLQGLGGWGAGALRIDLSMVVLHAAPGTATKPVLPGGFEPDCESGFPFPIPVGGALEGEVGYTCTNGGDCHLLVVQGKTLYEAYAVNVTASAVHSDCAVRWDLSRVYPRSGRGEQCTSADAAGLPIAPLLFNADEVAAAVATNGDIGHAIRFILPNHRMAAATYVHPATHAGAPSGPAASVPFGTRMRLKAGFDMSRYNPAAKALLRTMQRYGIILSDGGVIALTGEADRFTTAKWADLGLDEHVFARGTPSPQVSDFEVVESGPRYALTYDCVRNPEDFLFVDGYEH